MQSSTTEQAVDQHSYNMNRYTSGIEPMCVDEYKRRPESERVALPQFYDPFESWEMSATNNVKQQDYHHYMGIPIVPCFEVGSKVVMTMGDQEVEYVVTEVQSHMNNGTQYVNVRMQPMLQHIKINLVVTPIDDPMPSEAKLRLQEAEDNRRYQAFLDELDRMEVPLSHTSYERLVSPLVMAKMGQFVAEGEPWIPTAEELESVRGDMDIAMAQEFDQLINHTHVQFEVNQLSGTTVTLPPAEPDRQMTVKNMAEGPIKINLRYEGVIRDLLVEPGEFIPFPVTASKDMSKKPRPRYGWHG